jgi:hypothetical protein
MEGVEDLLLAGGDETGAVGVLDAQDELASALFGIDVIEEADVGRSYVGVAGWGWGDADADGDGQVLVSHEVNLDGSRSKNEGLNADKYG